MHRGVVSLAVTKTKLRLYGFGEQCWAGLLWRSFLDFSQKSTIRFNVKF